MAAFIKPGLLICLIGSFLSLGICSQKLLQASKDKNVMEDQYLVTLQANANDVAVEAVTQRLEQNGGSLLRKYVIGNRVILLVNGKLSAMAELASSSDILAIEPDKIVELEVPIEESAEIRLGKAKKVEQKSQGKGHPVCNTDHVGANGWGIIRTSYRSKPDFENDPYIYGEGDDGTGVDVYILDSGIRLTHDDFSGRQASWGHTSNHTASLNEPEDDLNGHGTHVAGIAAGNRFGVARKAHLIAVKVLPASGSAPWSDSIEGLEWIVNNVTEKKQQGKVTRSVVNVSLGSRGTSYALETAVQATLDAHVMVVTSAGNGATDTCTYTPQRMASILSVTATNINDSVAYFSNYGPCSDIMAPGQTIYGPGITDDSVYVIKSGTSMACPHVVGTIARYYSTLSESEAAAITPEMTKAYLIDEGSRGVIDLDEIHLKATPDRLLYKKCENSHEEPVVVTTTTTTATTTTTTSAATTTTTTTVPPTTTTLAQLMEDSWTTDNIGDMTLAALVMSAIILTSSMASLGMMYSSTIKV